MNRLENFIWNQDCVIMIGKFDGMHLGHQEIVNKVLEISKNNNLSKVVLSIDMKNDSVIMTMKEKINYFKNKGFDLFINCPFDSYLRTMTKEIFLNKILLKDLSVKSIVVGDDFKFGYMGQGDVVYLKDNEKLGYRINAIKPIIFGKNKISSSIIREEIEVGHIQYASMMLGYAYSFTGIAKRGNQIGRTIDIPTINIDLDNNKVLPPFGVYSGTCNILDGRDDVYQGIINIGIKPTISDNNNPNLEMHLLSFDEEVYGKTVYIKLKEYIRPEKKFSNLEELKKQIDVDLEKVRN